MRLAALNLAVFVLCLPLVSADGPAKPRADQPPTPTALAETVETRVVQLDVRVEGDPEAIRGLNAEDFVLHVDAHEVQGLIVDRLCGATSPPDSGTTSVPPSEGSEPKVVPQVTRPRATFIFFFDQPHLTLLGRTRSLETLRRPLTSDASLISRSRDCDID